MHNDAPNNPQHVFINPFVPNALFLYPLKISGCFQGVEKGCYGNEWVNTKHEHYSQVLKLPSEREQEKKERRFKYL